MLGVGLATSWRLQGCALRVCALVIFVLRIFTPSKFLATRNFSPLCFIAALENPGVCVRYG